MKKFWSKFTEKRFSWLDWTLYVTVYMIIDYITDKLGWN